MADPTSISGLDLWLKADTGITLTSGKVTGWADQSGSGNNLTTASTVLSPSYRSGLDPAIEFEFANQASAGNSTTPGEYMIVPTTLSTNEQAFTAFAVISVPALYGRSTAGSNPTVPQIIWGQTNTHAVFAAINGKMVLSNGSFQYPSPSLYPGMTNQVVGLVSNGTTVTAYCGGQASNCTGYAAGTVTGGYLGTFNTAVGSYGSFSLREAVHYNSALSTANVINLLDYFNYKYNLQPLQGTVVVCDGDSITAGSYQTMNGNYPRFLSLPSGYKVYNAGIPSQQIGTAGGVHGLIQNAATYVDPFLDTNADTNIYVAFAGTNDISSSNVSGATLYANMVTLCQARQAAGWKVVVVTILPRNNTTGTYNTPALFYAQSSAFNALVRSNWRSFANAIADVGGDGLIGQAASYLNTSYYWTDGIHPNSQGSSIIARYVRNAISSISNPGIHPVTNVF